MNKSMVLAALVLVGTAAAGCTDGGQTVEVGVSSTTAVAPTTTAPTSAAPTTTTAAVSTVAGPQSEALGAPATVSSAGAVAYTFSIDSVQPDPSCSGSAAATGDHQLLVQVSLTTTAAFVPGSLDLFNAADSLRVVAPDGTVTTAVRTAVADGCATGVGAVPDPVRAAMTYSFGFVVESPVTTGTLVYAPAGSDGWQWAFTG